jgi:uncharacterized protein (DUF433 family)
MPIADCLVAEEPPLRLEPDGTIRIGASRVTLDVLLDFYNGGMSPEEIADALPTVSLGEIYAAIAHYLRHKPEVDEYLERRREKAEELRQKWEEVAPSAGLRQRLQARHGNGSSGE